MNYTIGKDFFGKFDWGCYMEGYKEATKLLLNSLPTDKKNININIILPTLFLFRHFLELSFKEILSHEDFIYNSKDFEPNHNLKDLWIKVKTKIIIVLEQNKETEKNTNLLPYEEKISTINKLVEFFDKYDPQSYCYRYPQSKKMKSSLPNLLEINLDDFKNDFEKTQLFLSNIIITYVLNDKYYQ